MGTYGKGNSGSKYTVVEVCDDCDAANSADHNQSNAMYCYRRSSVVRVCLCLRNGDNHCKTDWTDRDAVWLGLSHITMCYIGGPDLHLGKGQFWGWASMGMPSQFTKGMDFWSNDAAFCQITLTSCLLFLVSPSGGPVILILHTEHCGEMSWKSHASSIKYRYGSMVWYGTSTKKSPVSCYTLETT